MANDESNEQAGEVDDAVTSDAVVPSEADVVAVVDDAKPEGEAVMVVTSLAGGDDAADSEASPGSGVNPKRRHRPEFADHELAALPFAGIAGGVFVGIAVIAFGVFALVL